MIHCCCCIEVDRWEKRDTYLVVYEWLSMCLLSFISTWQACQIRMELICFSFYLLYFCVYCLRSPSLSRLQLLGPSLIVDPTLWWVSLVKDAHLDVFLSPLCFPCLLFYICPCVWLILRNILSLVHLPLISQRCEEQPRITKSRTQTNIEPKATFSFFRSFPGRHDLFGSVHLLDLFPVCCEGAAPSAIFCGRERERERESVEGDLAHVLQLLGEILIGIVIIPAFLPEVFLFPPGLIRLIFAPVCTECPFWSARIFFSRPGK